MGGNEFRREFVMEISGAKHWEISLTTKGHQEHEGFDAENFADLSFSAPSASVATMSTKEKAVRLISELPNNVTWEEVEAQIQFVSGVEEARRDSEVSPR
jgi:hypothetical protein